MTHHNGFLQDIIEHPEDDAPRLIYADWLEEHGDSDRAEFIRVQCELAAPPWRVGRVYDDPAWLRLHARERELLEPGGLRHLPGPFWCAGGNHGWTYLDAEGARVGIECRFRRGFVAEVNLPCDQWMRQGPALVKAAPLQVVTVSDLHPSSRPPWHDWYPPWAHDMALAHYDVPAAVLPEPLWNALDWPTEDGKGPREPAMRGYPSEDAALDALSRACLKWARKPVAAHSLNSSHLRGISGGAPGEHAGRLLPRRGGGW
jgi:uncharacterized protein (TIGR02996 family)